MFFFVHAFLLTLQKIHWDLYFVFLYKIYLPLKLLFRTVSNSENITFLGLKITFILEVDIQLYILLGISNQTENSRKLIMCSG